MNEAWLAHHGIKGQKWGVRRFQNPDGSLTDAGKRRLAKEVVKSESLFGQEKHTKKLDKHLNELISDDQKRKLSELNKRWKTLQMDGGEAEDKLWLIVYDKFEKGEDYTFDDAMRDNPKLAKKLNDSEKAFSEYDKEAQKIVRKLVGKYAKTKMNTLSTNVGEKMYKELSKMAKEWEPDTSTSTSKPDFEKPKGGKNIPNKQPSNTQSFDQKRRDFMKTYKPTKGSPNSLLDIDDPDLIEMEIDDPDFRKEYGVSDSDYERWKKNVRN